MAVRKDEVNLQVTIGAESAGSTLRELKKEARDIRRALERIPVGTQAFDDAKTKLKAVTDQIAAAEGRTKQLVQQTGFWQRALAGAVGVFGGLSLDNIFSSVLSFGQKIFDVGTSLDSLNNKTRTVFGDAEEIVRGFAESNAQSLGLAQQEYVNLATNAGDLLKPMGFAEDAVANLSVSLTDQAGVLSEWTGGKVSTVEASEILTKALLGERDALNTLGIDIKDSLVQDELKKRGLQGLTGESKRQAEALVTLDLITKQSTSANEAFTKGTESAVRAKAELRARIAEITQNLAKFFIPIFNAALSAIIPVVDWVGRFGARLVEAYQKANTFRGIVTGVFNTIGTIVSNVASGIANLAEGFLNLFEGNFTAALDSFKAGFNNLNPLALGAEVKNAFVAGFNSKKIELVPPGEDEKAKKEGNKVGAAFANGFDAQFDALRKSGQRGGEAMAKAAKAALDLRLKEIETGYLKEELVAEVQRQKGQLNESDFGRQILVLKKQQYQQQIEAFKKFKQDETKEALEAQKKLLEVTQQLTPGKVAPLAPLGTTQPGAVTSQTAGIAGADISAANDEQALREKFARIVNLEQSNELARIDIQRNSLNARLEFLRNAGLQESAVFQETLGAKLKADEDYHAAIVENEKRSAELKNKVQEASFQVAKDFFQLAIDLLGQDEKARKKHGAAIKAFQAANVFIQGLTEVQKIWAHSADFGPVAGPIIAALQTGLAIGRTVLAIGKINATKFAKGTMMQFAKWGIFGGRSHSQGGTKGYFDDGTAIEVEKDEAFAVVNKRDTPMLRALSAINSQHGVPYFADGGMPKFATGGLPTVNTTPTTVASPQAAAQPLLSNMNSFMEAVDEFGRLVRVFPREVKSRVVYTELRDTANEVATVEADASI